MKTWRLLLWAMFVLPMLLATPAWAQSNNPRVQELPGREGQRIVEDAFAPGADPQPLQLPAGVELPAVPQVQPQYRVVSLPVKQFRVEGNTLLSPEQLSAALAPFENRDLTLEQVQAAANAVTRLYIEAGYLNSGVLIPDQDASAGVITLQAVEGQLNDIVLEGNDHLRSRVIKGRLRAGLGTHLNIRELEDSLRLMQQDPMIERVNARVLPGSQRGHSVLNLKVTERDPMLIRVGYNNHRSPSVGEDQGVVSFNHRSLTGNGDYLAFNYSLTEGAGDISVAYGIPLTARQLTLEGYYFDGDSDIVESPFATLDIVSGIQTAGIRLFQPVFRTLNHDVVVSLALENTQTESFLSGEPFSFSPGEKLGESEATLLRLATEWTWRRAEDALYLRGALSHGVDLFSPTDNGNTRDGDGQRVDDLPEGEFTALLLQANYARLLPFAGSQLLARFTAQVSSDPLLASQRLAVGGATTVRGYRENQLVRDNGVIASLELRVPLFRDENGESRFGLSVAPFFDYGWAKDEPIGLPGLNDPQADELMSVGLGALWNGWEPLYLEVYYGEALKDAGNTGNSLQEDGWHIRTWLQWSF